MNYNGIYVASEKGQSVSAAGPLIELQVPSGVIMELIRAWIGAAEGTDPLAEVQEVELYVNDGPATGGTALTEQKVRGSDDATASVVALGGPTIAATEISIYPDGFHLSAGWLYLPVPEERIRIVGGTTNDNLGMTLPVAPDAASTLSYGMIWGEIG